MSKRDKGSVLECCKSRRNGTLSVVILAVLFCVAAASVGFFLLRRSPKAEPTLRFLSILHRHGERVPEVIYPRDPYKNNETIWPDLPGQLLQKGKVTMFELGRFLRHRYDGFISSRYKSTEVSVISSFVDRCMMSAELVLAGLFPPVGNQIWNGDLLWQPIPVFSVPGSHDEMIRVAKACPLLSKEREYLDTNVIQKIMNENKEVIDYVSKNTGLKVKTIGDVADIYDNLVITEEQGLKLPEWTRDVYPDKLRNLSLINDWATLDTPTMIKLKSGVFINDILSNMKEKASGQLERRLKLYSAHHTTVVRLWRGMDITQEPQDPNYGAVFIVELHEINGKYRVKILYKDYAHSKKEMAVLNTRRCENDEAIHQDGMCDLDVFNSALQSVAITDFDKACRISP